MKNISAQTVLAMNFDTEQTAWLWLMALPRLEIPANTPARRWRELSERQLKIEACPGKLHTNRGAPLVRISALLPGCKKRLHGSGNNLYMACDRLQHEAWRIGIQLPFMSVFHFNRQREANNRVSGHKPAQETP